MFGSRYVQQTIPEYRQAACDNNACDTEIVTCPDNFCDDSTQGGTYSCSGGSCVATPFTCTTTPWCVGNTVRYETCVSGACQNVDNPCPTDKICASGQCKYVAEFSSYAWIFLVVGLIAVAFFLVKKRLK